jgi:RHH-type transcriptional regulator, proline utilization regulon repressor / proline dehydrogenase / delta 1-pyrroline-5-carboxylate dehydrogenase
MGRIEINSLTEQLSRLYLADEVQLVSKLADAASSDEGDESIVRDNLVRGRAAKWVSGVRSNAGAGNSIIDAFLQEYGLSTKEGIILMRLSEALIRTPDFVTAQELMRDKLEAGSWFEHSGASPAALINGATAGLRLSSGWINATGGTAARNLASKLGDRVLHLAIVRGMGIMADHFVLGSTIESAISRGKKDAVSGTVHSFDMLGEAARTHADADRYFTSYRHAANCLARETGAGVSVASSPGLSVKLSALHPRYEFANRQECVPVLVERVKTLALIAKSGGAGLTLDAEEADRLEISLTIFDALLNDPDLADWDGLGIVVQAYQRRATAVIDHLVSSAQTAGRKIAVRLVKGAYWDMEIKRAQELGLASYPVFTRKEHTDVSYLACARQLLSAGNCVFPQFATHNAHTASAILSMADGSTHLEFQRLHGMGAPLHAAIKAQTGIGSRVYAPVGNHKELLPYLVRRLLENGANSSFVNQLMNPDVAIDEIVRDPVHLARSREFEPSPAIPMPCDVFGGVRMSAKGTDLTQTADAAAAEALLPMKHAITAASIVNGQICLAAADDTRDIVNPANLDEVIGRATHAAAQDIDAAIASARRSKWAQDVGPGERNEILNRMADLIEANTDVFMALCVAEAGKSLPDAVAEIREAVDFCRYYAAEAVSTRIAPRRPRGIVVCISPWNFPLAIFVGQVAAALAVGNSVIAKPAEQTPIIAFEAVKLFHEAGVHKDALHLILGGAEIGALLTQNTQADLICFTGSTQTAKRIALSRANVGYADTPLIAETGGVNVMIVDSTALLEQATADVVASAFQSAGQRCSACRVVCVQDDIADEFEKMLAGAMQLLRLGNPALLATDIGPVIDVQALQKIKDYVDLKRDSHRIVGEAPFAASLSGYFFAPIAIAMRSLNEVTEEIFGPVLHIVRFRAQDIGGLVDQVNALGFGLTMGLHSRIDTRIKSIAAHAKVGNLYVNRNQIGAVVGVQPFGGEGLSGTGPKAGGPHYLLRLSLDSDEQKKLKSVAVVAPSNRPLAGNAANDATNQLIKKAQAAQRGWKIMDCGPIIGHLASLTGLNSPEYSALLSQFTHLQQDIILPGPTGEENSLRLCPLGVIVVTGADELDESILQILCALASGNAVIAAMEDEAGRKIAKRLQVFSAQNKIPDGLLILAGKDDMSALLQGEIGGVLADGDRRNQIADILARKPGPMIPLLSLRDYPERFFHERTLTVNTTAAGGNASLLIA